MDDPGVATCISCHSPGGKHDILAMDDPKSSVYPTHVARPAPRAMRTLN